MPPLCDRIGRVRLKIERLYHEDRTVYWGGPMAIRPSDPEYAFCLAKDDQLILDKFGEGRNMLYTTLRNLYSQGARRISFHTWADGPCRGCGSKQYDELRALGCELPHPSLKRNVLAYPDEKQIYWACYYAGLDVYRCHCMNSWDLCQDEDWELLLDADDFW